VRRAVLLWLARPRGWFKFCCLDFLTWPLLCLWLAWLDEAYPTRMYVPLALSSVLLYGVVSVLFTLTVMHHYGEEPW